MKLIVGLGNPGKQFINTRHNVGFMVADCLADTLDVKFDNEKNDALYAQTVIKGEKVIILKPQRFINLSGEVIAEFIKYFKIDVNDMLVINDDLDLPVGSYKLKSNGSSGGHNGLKNIELHLNTSEYKRLKIGISNNKNIETRDYVLGTFSSEEKIEINKIIETSKDIIEAFIETDMKQVMNYYNKR
jgi:PTH1 family peptidyl-tRNA hydrolase